MCSATIEVEWIFSEVLAVIVELTEVVLPYRWVAF